LIVRNGTVLPDSRVFPNVLLVSLYGALQGSSVYLNLGGSLYKMALGNRGIVDLGYAVGIPEGIIPQTLRPFGSDIYCASGFVLDANSLNSITNLNTHGLVTTSPTENAVYYLNPTFNAPVISRFAHPSMQKTSTAELEGISSTGLRSLAGYRITWHSTMRRPFTSLIWIRSTVGGHRRNWMWSKAHLSQSSLAVVSTSGSPSPTAGPNVANVTLTETISSGSAYSSFGAFTCGFSNRPIRELRNLSARRGVFLCCHCSAANSGPFTNTVLLSSTNTEPAQTVSTQIISVVPPEGPVTTIAVCSLRAWAVGPRMIRLTTRDPESFSLRPPAVFG
jgi:hypothetical protein